MSRRWLGTLMLRFVALYAALLVVASWAPVFPWMEAAAVRTVNLVRSADATPLRLEARDDDWYYRVETRAGASTDVSEHRYHPHAYVLLLFVALVLATPGLGLARRGAGLVVGGALVFLLGVGLLMSDVHGWEHAALVETGAAVSDAGGGGPLVWLAWLHRTAGAALLPVMLWAMLVVRPPR